MRVLALASEPPQPLNNAIKRIVWNLLTRLDASVHLITWNTPGTSAADLDTIAERLPLTTVLPTRSLPLDGLSRVRRQARFVGGGHPPYVQAGLEERHLDTEAGARRFASFVDELNHRQQFDVVVAFEEAMTAVPLPILPARKVVHRLNILTEVLDGQRGQSPLARAAWRLERPGWERSDRRTMAGVDLAIANTEEMTAELRDRYPDHRVATLPTGTDMSSLTTPAEQRRDLAFIGWMSYEPNIDAATWLAREVWPEVREAHPETKLRIIGREPSPEVRALQAIPGVTVTGEVADIVSASEGVAVGVVPLRRGRGMKTKTLELMAMGLPTVTLPVGAEGITAGPDEGLIVATDASSMAHSVINLLNDPAAAAALGDKARGWVSANHGWDQIAHLYSSLLKGGSDG